MGKKSQKLEGITEIKSEGRAAGAVGIFTMSLKPHAWQKNSYLSVYSKNHFHD